MLKSDVNDFWWKKNFFSPKSEKMLKSEVKEFSCKKFFLTKKWVKQKWKMKWKNVPIKWGMV